MTISRKQWKVFLAINCFCLPWNVYWVIFGHPWGVFWGWFGLVSVLFYIGACVWNLREK